MKVYLVYENDEWEGTNELDSVYGTKERAAKRAAEIMLSKWDEYMDGELEDYNKKYNTHLTREQFAAEVAKDGGYGDEQSSQCSVGGGVFKPVCRYYFCFC